MEPEGLLLCSQEPVLVPVLSQINPIHTFLPYISMIHHNIIPHIYAQIFQLVSSFQDLWSKFQVKHQQQYIQLIYVPPNTQT